MIPINLLHLIFVNFLICSYITVRNFLYFAGMWKNTLLVCAKRTYQTEKEQLISRLFVELNEIH